MNLTLSFYFSLKIIFRKFLMILTNLSDDILNIILSQINIKCHTCNLKYTLKKSFYIKQHQFYYCSKQCYNFI